MSDPLPNVPGIVRNLIPGVDFVHPGMLVLTCSLTFSASAIGSFLFVVKDRPDFIFRSPAQNVLPFYKYLKRQPSDKFWTLVSRDRVATQDANHSLSEPMRQEFGPFPFHFESIGELQYYVEQQKLRRADFLVSYTSALKLRPEGF